VAVVLARAPLGKEGAVGADAWATSEMYRASLRKSQRFKIKALPCDRCYDFKNIFAQKLASFVSK
jgi:hypothetical protein